MRSVCVCVCVCVCVQSELKPRDSRLGVLFHGKIPRMFPAMSPRSPRTKVGKILSLSQSNTGEKNKNKTKTKTKQRKAISGG